MQDVCENGEVAKNALCKSFSNKELRSLTEFPYTLVNSLFFSWIVIRSSNWLVVNIRGIQRRCPPKYTKNTFWAIQSTFRYLETHSKRRYKLCICSVILGELESFRNYEGFSIIFPKILDAIINVLRRRKLFWFLFPSHFWIRKF